MTDIGSPTNHYNAIENTVQSIVSLDNLLDQLMDNRPNLKEVPRPIPLSIMNTEAEIHVLERQELLDGGLEHVGNLDIVSPYIELALDRAGVPVLFCFKTEAALENENEQYYKPHGETHSEVKCEKLTKDILELFKDKRLTTNVRIFKEKPVLIVSNLHEYKDDIDPLNINDLTAIFYDASQIDFTR